MGPRCPGTCRKRFYAKDNYCRKQYTQIFWSEWKCDVCEQEFLYEDQEKHFKTCLKYQCRSTNCKQNKVEYANADELAKHYASECCDTILTCTKCEGEEFLSKKAMHNCIWSLQARVKATILEQDRLKQEIDVAKKQSERHPQMCYMGHPLVEMKEENPESRKDRLSAWNEDEQIYSTEVSNLVC